MRLQLKKNRYFKLFMSLSIRGSETKISGVGTEPRVKKEFVWLEKRYESNFNGMEFN